MRIGRLFVGASRTNASHRCEFCIASWSYATNYWRWAFYWSPPMGWREVFRLPRVGPCKNMGKDWFGYWGITSFSGWAILPLIGGFTLSTQPPMESMKHRAKAQP